VTTLRQQLIVSNAASQMSVNGCPLIVSSLIRTRPSCCGSERDSLSQRGPFPVLQLGLDLITSSDYVRLLGATITPDLNLDRHVSVVSASCFYWLRQLRRTRRSLDQESAVTLVHAFVTSRVDYCNILLAGAPKVTTDKFQRVLNAAARVLIELVCTGNLSVHTSSIGACRDCCTPSCTGSTYLSESHTSSESSCSTASTVELHSI